MKLYYAPASSYSQRVLIALYEKNAIFKSIEVDLFNPEVRARYIQSNPFAKIPALETEDGKVIFEACIIIEYLDLYCRREPRLLPKDQYLALEVRKLERIIDLYINGGRQVLFDDTQRPVAARGGKEVVKARRLVETACVLLNERLQHHTWLAGDEFSLADCTAAPTLTYLRMVYSYKHLPRLMNYVQRLESRPSVALVQRDGYEQMMRMLAMLPHPLGLVALNS
uniref:Tjp3 n=1 Tax=Symphyonema bifilamentata 97.28 TaxID=2721247 RepID=A0A6H0DXQ2_9CYAN|nr:Tjp3 [Symphyonema bifilamentata 97.28]